MKKFFLAALSAFAVLISANFAPVYAEELDTPSLYVTITQDMLEELPNPNTVWDKDKYPYALIMENKLYLCQGFYHRVADNDLIIEGNLQWYTLSEYDSGEYYWEHAKTSNADLGDQIEDVLWASSNILNHSTGEVMFTHDPTVFPMPLPQQILVVVAEAILTAKETILGSMAFLTALGVSCLAFMISLPVLRRVLGTFHN